MFQTESDPLPPNPPYQPSAGLIGIYIYTHIFIHIHVFFIYIYVYISEVGGVRPTGKLFRFVSCVRAVCLSSEIGVKKSFRFCFLCFQVFPFPLVDCYFVRSFVCSFVRSFFRSLFCSFVGSFVIQLMR